MDTITQIKLPLIVTAAFALGFFGGTIVAQRYSGYRGDSVVGSYLYVLDHFTGNVTFRNAMRANWVSIHCAYERVVRIDVLRNRVLVRRHG
jgi:hypothetical protein